MNIFRKWSGSSTYNGNGYKNYGFAIKIWKFELQITLFRTIGNEDDGSRCQ